MPILRYFVVVGLVLLGGLFAVDYFVPKQTAVAARDTGDTLASWRASEARKSVHARSAATNNFTQSFAMFAPSPAFGLSAHDEPALEMRSVVEAAANNDNKADPRVASAKTEASRVQEMPRKPRRQQMAQTAANAGANPGHALRLPQPSADSLRQDAMARDMTRDMMARAAQQRPAFAPPQWPQQQWPQQPGFREANARMQNPFAPRMW